MKFSTWKLFSIILFIVLITGVFVIRYISNKTEIKTENEITEIYMGDSHITCAIDDKLISNGKNLAAISEPLYFTYFKMINYLKVNPQVRTVYVGFSYHNLSGYCDEFVSGEFSNHISPKYFFSLPLINQLQLIRWNLTNFIAFTKNVVEVGEGIINKNDSLININSGYSNKFWRTIALPKSIDNRTSYLFYYKGSLYEISNSNIAYLKKIVDYCKSENVALKILQTPVHPYFYSKIPPEYITKYDEIINSSKLTVINFENRNFTDSSFAPDGSHMSMLGACQVTNELNRINNRHTAEVICEDIYR